MEEDVKNQIKVQTTVTGPIEKAWQYYTDPAHIIKWNNASPDWQTPRAENDLRVGGRFLSRMEAKDGSAGFDFTGTYTEVTPDQKIAYIMDGEDKRKVAVEFVHRGGERTKVTVTFDPENENPLEMQRGGWQSILDNFKKYVEEN
jgi:uncharacterized protein YndB with AHSA1/START domain